MTNTEFLKYAAIHDLLTINQIEQALIKRAQETDPNNWTARAVQGVNSLKSDPLKMLAASGGTGALAGAGIGGIGGALIPSKEHKGRNAAIGALLGALLGGAGGGALGYGQLG